MTEVTSSPAFVWSATVPPQPRSSSSGWAAMTRIRRLGMDGDLDAETLARPLLRAERLPPQRRPSLVRDFQEDHGARPACDHLTARRPQRTDDRSQHFTRLADGPGVGWQRGFPDP